METALLLNHTQLGPNQLSVTSADGSSHDDDSHYTKNDQRDSDDITQEEKPRTRILAEYLAHGYIVGDAAIERAIQLDTKYDVSTRFLSTIQNLDQKTHATDRAKATDQSYGITERAGSFLTGIGSYFEKAADNPAGRTIVKFYTDSTRQVQDIYAEAKRLAELKKQEAGGSAYKAAGLESVFGKEAPKDTSGQASGKRSPLPTGAFPPGSRPQDPSSGSGVGVGVGVTAGADAGAGGGATKSNATVGADDNTTAESATKTADIKDA